MKKLLFFSLLFVSAFSLRGQAVFELQVLPVCWQYTENADSTLYAYWLMSSQSEVPRLISYLNVSGSVVAGVDAADISANPCCCDSADSSGPAADSIAVLQDSIIILYDGDIELSRDTIPPSSSSVADVDWLQWNDSQATDIGDNLYTNGFVNIGATSRNHPLYVEVPNATSGARFGSGQSGDIFFYRQSSNTSILNEDGFVNNYEGIVWNQTSNHLSFYTNGQQQLFIDATGEIGLRKYGVGSFVDDTNASPYLAAYKADGNLYEISPDSIMVTDPLNPGNTITLSEVLANDNHLGTNDQELTANRTTDFGTFFYTWDLRDAILDQFAHPVLSPDNRILGWYVADGGGEMSWATNSVISSTFRSLVSNNLIGSTFLGNDLDRTYLEGDKLFLSLDTLNTDNSLPALLGRDPVTGEVKELEVSSIAGSGGIPVAGFVPPRDTLVFDSSYYYQPRISPAGGLTYSVDTTGAKFGATIMGKIQADTLPVFFDPQWFDPDQMANIRSGDTLVGTHVIYFEYTPYGVAVSVPTNNGFVANNDTTSNPPSNFTLPEGYPATVGTLEFELDGRFNISEIGDTVFWKSTVDTLDYFYNDIAARKPDIITNGLLLDADDWLEAGPTGPFTHNTDTDGYAITYAINPSNANYSVITRAANETDRILAKNGNTDYCGSVIFTGQGGTAGLKVVTIDIPPSGPARLYINGVEVSTDTTVGADARNATFDRIGRMVFEDFYLDGEIKYLALNRFVSGGITATEAQNIFIHVNERILNEAL